ncbi:tyrosine-type recombinase/integrase [Variovorax sp. J22R133]|uniref:tyrosine-type recombinase/integrase n=1 Tax=Variovorax brevis TaxID=3053503 RepID=UPI002576B315|nr:tyrosine-type recombinase/integrase [Variovorax sp. J22R133]MDM0117508.1 tyrosine-type recombinase/integrase [Variovorax sp. J22R133]
MQHKFVNSKPAISVPTTTDMRRVWRADRCVHDSSAVEYLHWIRRFRAYCAERGLDERSELTLSGARRFIAWYGRRRQLEATQLGSARTALYALTRVYVVLGIPLPAWRKPVGVRPPASALLRAYSDHLARQRGNPAPTVRKRLNQVDRVLEYLARRGKTWRTMTLLDIDEFLIEFSHRYARSTTADIAGGIRSFARFLLATGRISLDLADAVVSPVRPPRYAQPRRALPWEDVQCLLRAVDTSSARGLRDHAVLLMMCTYGFGAGEVIRLRLEDIDWGTNTLTVVRPKTGVAFTLPLLPAVAKVLARYLRHGRPPHTPTRHLFVQMKMPFDPLTASSAVRHILIKHAHAAGIEAQYLGSHVLRYSNAARQLDVGTRPRVLSDLLGHRDSESISAYVRIATESLREVSLPVPS